MRDDKIFKQKMRFFLSAGIFLVMTRLVYADVNEESNSAIFSRIANVIRSISMDNKNCVKKIKKNKGVPTWDTWACYDIQRYVDDSPLLKKTKEKIILSDSYGVLASEKVAETPACTELRDLNFAILASSPQITYHRLHQLISRYNQRMMVADEVQKRFLYEQLSKEVRPLLPLYLKEVCSLGVNQNQVGEIRRVKGTMLSSDRIKQDGLYLFAEDILYQLNTISLARDIAEGKADDKTKRAEEVD